MAPVSSSRKSKRGAFRIQCCDHPIFYKTADDEGTACLTDLSATGCALRHATGRVGMHEKILISFPLPEREDEDRLEAAGRVVRLCAKGFAVEFQIMDVETFGALRSYFFRQLRDEMGDRQLQQPVS